MEQVAEYGKSHFVYGDSVYDTGNFFFSLFFFFFLLFRATLEALPSLVVESELQLPAYATATATPYLGHFCYLHYSSQQCQILNSWARPGIKPTSLMDTSQVCCCWATMGTSRRLFSAQMDRFFFFKEQLETTV